MSQLSQQCDFFFKSTIYYTVHGGRPWQLLCNYVQEKQTNKRTKTKKERKQGKMTNREGEEKEIKNINQVQLGKK